MSSPGPAGPLKVTMKAAGKIVAEGSGPNQRAADFHRQ